MENSQSFNRPVLLSSSHNIDTFNCGVSALNNFLKNYALTNQKNYAARTFVATRNNCVVGFYTLVAASVEPSSVPPRIKKGLAKYPIPIILIARLAVDLTEQGKGLGKALLKDALLRSLSVTENIGARAILVHAKDQQAKQFYEHFGFEASPIDEYHLYLLMKDVIQNIQ
jgi:GNAT superfamily N-acetyltransferase